MPRKAEVTIEESITNSPLRRSSRITAVNPPAPITRARRLSEPPENVPNSEKTETKSNPTGRRGTSVTKEIEERDELTKTRSRRNSLTSESLNEEEKKQPVTRSRRHSLTIDNSTNETVDTPRKLRTRRGSTQEEKLDEPSHLPIERRKSISEESENVKKPTKTRRKSVDKPDETVAVERVTRNRRGSIDEPEPEEKPVVKPKRRLSITEKELVKTDLDLSIINESEENEDATRKSLSPFKKKVDKPDTDLQSSNNVEVKKPRRFLRKSRIIQEEPMVSKVVNSNDKLSETVLDDKNSMPSNKVFNDEKSKSTKKINDDEKSDSPKKVSDDENFVMHLKVKDNKKSVSPKNTSDDEKSVLPKKAGNDDKLVSLDKDSNDENSTSPKKVTDNEKSMSLKKVSDNETSVSSKKDSEDGKSVSPKKVSDNEKSVSSKKDNEDEKSVSLKKVSDNEKSVSFKKDSEDEKSVSSEKVSDNEKSVSSKKDSEDEKSVSPKKVSDDEKSMLAKNVSDDEKYVADVSENIPTENNFQNSQVTEVKSVITPLSSTNEISIQTPTTKPVIVIENSKEVINKPLVCKGSVSDDHLVPQTLSPVRRSPRVSRRSNVRAASVSPSKLSFEEHSTDSDLEESQRDRKQENDEDSVFVENTDSHNENQTIKITSTVSDGSDGSFNFHLNTSLTKTDSQSTEEKLDKSDLNISIQSNSSDKENIPVNENLKIEFVKNLSELEFNAGQAGRPSNVFRPKNVDYSFVEPMDVDQTMLNITTKTVCLDEPKEQLSKTEFQEDGEGDDTVNDSFKLSLSVTHNQKEDENEEVDVSKVDEKIDREELKVNELEISKNEDLVSTTEQKNCTKTLDNIESNKTNTENKISSDKVAKIEIALHNISKIDNIDEFSTNKVKMEGQLKSSINSTEIMEQSIESSSNKLDNIQSHIQDISGVEKINQELNIEKLPLEIGEDSKLTIENGVSSSETISTKIIDEKEIKEHHPTEEKEMIIRDEKVMPNSSTSEINQVIKDNANDSFINQSVTNIQVEINSNQKNENEEMNEEVTVKVPNLKEKKNDIGIVIKNKMPIESTSVLGDNNKNINEDVKNQKSLEISEIKHQHEDDIVKAVSGIEQPLLSNNNPIVEHKVISEEEASQNKYKDSVIKIEEEIQSCDNVLNNIETVPETSNEVQGKFKKQKRIKTIEIQESEESKLNEKEDNNKNNEKVCDTSNKKHKKSLNETPAITNEITMELSRELIVNLTDYENIVDNQSDNEKEILETEQVPTNLKQKTKKQKKKKDKERSIIVVDSIEEKNKTDKTKSKRYRDEESNHKNNEDKESDNSKLDEYLYSKLSRTEASEDEVSIEEVEEKEESNEFILSMAEEGEEDTPSEDSNQIIDEGESINTTESERETDDDYDDLDSFICDDEENELLSGEEYDLEDADHKDKRKKKSRLINVEDIDSDVINIPKKEKLLPVKKKSRIIKYPNSSDEEEQNDVNDSITSKSEDNSKLEDNTVAGTKIISKEKRKQALSRRKTVDKEGSLTFVKPNQIDVKVQNSGDESAGFSDFITSEDNVKNVSIRSNKPEVSTRSSINIQENIKVRDIQDSPLRDRINLLVDSFCSNMSKGDISLNLALEYQAKSSESALSDGTFEQEKKSKKRHKAKINRSQDSIVEGKLSKKRKICTSGDNIQISRKESTQQQHLKRRSKSLDLGSQEIPNKKRKKYKKSKVNSMEDIRMKHVKRLPAAEDLQAKSFSIMNQLITDVRNRPRRTLKPSTPKTDLGSSWLVEEVPFIKPSTSIVSKQEVERFKFAKIHPKDFRNQMLYDPSRVKRIETKKLLAKRGAYL